MLGVSKHTSNLSHDWVHRSELYSSIVQYVFHHTQICENCHVFKTCNRKFLMSYAVHDLEYCDGFAQASLYDRPLGTFWHLPCATVGGEYMIPCMT
jgi:hypothetical protein